VPGPDNTIPHDSIPHNTIPEADTAEQWWRSAVVYQIYPRSFADSDGDGIGDLPGITSRLSHLSSLGVDAVWLSPFYPSPQHDAGYDVSDYRDVDPRFGSLADFDLLIARAAELGIRVIVDIVPNHSSYEHRDFKAALGAEPGSPERAMYIFREGGGDTGEVPPNNWSSFFRGPAWTRVTEPDGASGQWYLHLFDTSQPDWDWNNPAVHDDFRHTLRFWIERGVAGFRVDVAHGLVKEEGLPDWTGDLEELLAAGVTVRSPYANQDGVHEIYREWRRVLDGYPGEHILVAEAWVEPASLANYVRPDEMNQAFNFTYLRTPWAATELHQSITASMASNDTVGAPTTWVLSNHDVIRHSTRFGYPLGTVLPKGIGATDPQPDRRLGLRRSRAATQLMLALPGSAYLYQGEELGLPEATELPDEARQDPTWARSGHSERGRDGCRVPIPWKADAPSFGFGPGSASWLPQPPMFAKYAVDVQDGVKGSTLELYRAALRLRREHHLGSGTLAWADGYAEGVLAFRNGDLLVVANTTDGPIALPAGADVLLSSEELPADGSLPADSTAWLIEA